MDAVERSVLVSMLLSVRDIANPVATKSSDMKRQKSGFAKRHNAAYEKNVAINRASCKDNQGSSMSRLERMNNLYVQNETKVCWLRTNSRNPSTVGNNLILSTSNVFLQFSALLIIIGKWSKFFSTHKALQPSIIIWS